MQAFQVLLDQLDRINGTNGKVAALTDHLQQTPAADAAWALVLFLGDNIYEVGARPDFRSVDLEHLTVQSAVLGDDPRAVAVFLPGNHDWARGAPHPRAPGRYRPAR